MLFEEMLQNERKAGHKAGHEAGHKVGLSEAILIVLDSKGVISESLSQKITSESDFSKLEKWLHLSVQVSSVSEFESKM